MKSQWCKCAAGMMMVFLVSVNAFGIEVIRKEDKELDINIHGQVLGFGERVKDPSRNDLRLYLFLKQARLNFKGRFDDFKYHMQLVFGGEEEVKDKNASLGLLDLSVDFPITSMIRLKIGQFNVPYSRERVTDDAFFLFTDRSIQNLGFRVGRDVGVAVHGYFPYDIAATIGVFTGGGRDIPLRFIPQKLGTPLFVTRFGINKGLDEDIFTLKQNNFRKDSSGWALFMNGLFMRDSNVGHSTVMNVKATEKSLLTNSNWNPFINLSPLDRGDLWQGGADFAVRTSVSSCIVSAEAEANYAKYANGYGGLSLMGGRMQTSLYKAPFEVAVRYAALRPDSRFRYFDSKNKTTFDITPTGGLIHEVGPSLNFYFKEHHAKIIFEPSVLINVPVATEPGIGSYVLTDQVDQTSVLALSGASVARKVVPQAKLLFQMNF
ncbi:MAG: hypothetical protein A3I05_03275 [Deltaproteobacteria bacterium RIFCSPLOWO2_02_FULL_44_10]|nr:MAG: hypothetical protein A3C46_02850 [Deltaproteobacteria bacterium RIFCSPHIGHO2_02_FULL_44_16]OGQ46195.1 MAG: hypothetical protein A3I05_03275 [Deltaproteobacteria bacterium RIFCSPLOWO2_02_FULL_44_10]